jgi:hypothetical protein
MAVKIRERSGKWRLYIGTDSEGAGEMIVAPFHPRRWSFQLLSARYRGPRPLVHYRMPLRSDEQPKSRRSPSTL